MRIDRLLMPLALSTLLIGGCSSVDGEARASLDQAVVYGEDGRRDVFAEPDPTLRQLALESSAALVWQQRVSVRADGSLDLDTLRLDERLPICDGERFAEQPTLAECSAVLIDGELLLTAGHCLGASAEEARDRCRDTLVLFGFALAGPDRLAEQTLADAYACREVVLHAYDPEDTAAPDYAVIRLDRPVEAPHRAPSAVARRASAGAALHLIGNGAGLPTKIDSSGVVLDPALGEDFFTASSDSFSGGSGSGLFDEDGALLGVQVRGRPDWVYRGSSGCAETAVEEQGFETHQYAARAVAALGTAAGWDDAASRCGDAVCSPLERGSCDEDCARLMRVPPQWLCSPRTFADGSVCERECGAVDPDCQLEAERLDSGRGCALAAPGRVGSLHALLLLILVGWARLQRPRRRRSRSSATHAEILAMGGAWTPPPPPRATTLAPG
jgi:hypothetical protein